MQNPVFVLSLSYSAQLFLYWTMFSDFVTLKYFMRNLNSRYRMLLKRDLNCGRSLYCEATSHWFVVFARPRLCAFSNFKSNRCRSLCGKDVCSWMISSVLVVLEHAADKAYQDLLSREECSKEFQPNFMRMRMSRTLTLYSDDLLDR